MSATKDVAKDGEGFLSRWSRLKRGEDQPLPATGKTPVLEPEPAGANTPVSAEAVPSLIDLTKLPRLDELTSNSDFAAFLQKGVPEELKRLALRKAWSLDPAIRDFVEVAENQYDWNTPGGVPGFGEIAPGTDMQALLAQAIGDMPKAVVEEVEVVEEVAVGRSESVGRSERAEAPVSGTALDPAKSDTPSRAASDFAGAAPSAPSGAPAGSLRPTATSAEPPRIAQKPRHGGALPRLPT